MAVLESQAEAPASILVARTWFVVVALGLLVLSALVYGCLTREGRANLSRLRSLAVPSAGSTAELALPTPPPQRPAALWWLAQDGLWSVQEQAVAAAVPERIEQLCNLVLDRLGLDLLVVQAFVGDDDVV